MSKKFNQDLENALQLASVVASASLYWSGKDEEKNPHLKTARTLAFIFLQDFGEREKS